MLPQTFQPLLPPESRTCLEHALHGFAELAWPSPLVAVQVVTSRSAGRVGPPVLARLARPCLNRLRESWTCPAGTRPPRASTPAPALSPTVLGRPPDAVARRRGPRLRPVRADPDVVNSRRETSEAGARSNASPTSRTEHRAESLNTAATSSRRNGVWSLRRTGYSRLHVLQEGLQHLGHVPHAASEAGRSSTYRAGSCADTRLAAGSRSKGRQPPLRESRPAGGLPQNALLQSAELLPRARGAHLVHGGHDLVGCDVTRDADCRQSFTGQACGRECG